MYALVFCFLSNSCRISKGCSLDRDAFSSKKSLVLNRESCLEIFFTFDFYISTLRIAIRLSILTSEFLVKLAFWAPDDMKFPA